jgi:hypothetical protein
VPSESGKTGEIGNAFGEGQTLVYNGMVTDRGGRTRHRFPVEITNVRGSLPTSLKFSFVAKEDPYTWENEGK